MSTEGDEKLTNKRTREWVGEEKTTRKREIQNKKLLVYFTYYYLRRAVTLNSKFI
jgi:hypothetical protein